MAFPGALPRAGLKARLWRSGNKIYAQTAQTPQGALYEFNGLVDNGGKTSYLPGIAQF
jgi:hypothetical protein